MTGATSTSALRADAEATLRSQPSAQHLTNTSTIRKRANSNWCVFVGHLGAQECASCRCRWPVNCAPSLASLHKSRSPLLSINVTSLSLRRKRGPHACDGSSSNMSEFMHPGIGKPPCRIHLSSAGVSLKLIFNMLFSSGLVSEKSLAIARTIVLICRSFFFGPPSLLLLSFS